MAQLPISPGEDHHGAAYYIRQGTEPAPTLPLRSSPMRFAVMRKDGLSSNAWRVWVDPAPDAYVLCRDHMKEMKASLHQSGKQHIAFTSKTGIEMTKGSRFWNQWTEPQYYDGSQVIPTLNLFFSRLGAHPDGRNEAGQSRNMEYEQPICRSGGEPTGHGNFICDHQRGFRNAVQRRRTDTEFPVGHIASPTGQKTLDSRSPRGRRQYERIGRKRDRCGCHKH